MKITGTARDREPLHASQLGYN